MHLPYEALLAAGFVATLGGIAYACIRKVEPLQGWADGEPIAPSPLVSPVIVLESEPVIPGPWTLAQQAVLTPEQLALQANAAVPYIPSDVPLILTPDHVDPPSEVQPKREAP